MTTDKKKSASVSHKCQFCNKVYKTDAGFAKHECSQKLRYEVRDTMAARLGLHAFNEFYRVQMGQTKLKSPAEFEKSQYYKAFLRFGDYCVNTKALEPQKFAEYLVKKRVRVDKWGTDANYTEFLIHLLTTEPVANALERAILYAHSSTEGRDLQPRDVIRYGSDNSIIHAITSGKISAWVLYNCESGQNWIRRLRVEHWALIHPYINDDVWSGIFKDKPNDVSFAATILKTAGW